VTRDPTESQPRRLPQRQSLVAQTIVILRDQIHSGVWARHLPSERELCQELFIGRVTLRAALAQLQREGLVKGGRGRRREVARRKHKVARTSVSRNVVLLTDYPLFAFSPFTMFWIDDLREHLAASGYHLEVCSDPACYIARPTNALAELVERLRPAGWVLARCTAPMQQWFSQRGLPCVVTGSLHKGVALPSVDIDHQAVCRHAAGLLLARGHARLAFLNPSSGLAGDLASEQGFAEGAAKIRQSGGEALIVHHEGTRQSVCNRLKALLQRRPSPTGFLVSDPLHALTTLGYLMCKGLCLPRDAALISRDDDLFLEHSMPAIARYATSPTFYARKVSRLVLELVQSGAGVPRDYRVMPRFVPGETLG
jgi:DNA-binding LacI/PurR family transcriptional regulator